MCPRCGGPSKNKGNPAGRCTGCLKKLRQNKKDPKRWEHANKIADDALRRQKGDTPTTTAKNGGHGSRREIIEKVKEGYRKYGTRKTLSPDRKNNAKGYESSNVEMVPKELNRGRHRVDKKKLSKWKQTLKKADICTDHFTTIVLAKAEEAKIGPLDIDLFKSNVLHDKDATLNLIVDSEDPQAEELAAFVLELTEEELSDILFN